MITTFPEELLLCPNSCCPSFHPWYIHLVALLCLVETPAPTYMGKHLLLLAHDLLKDRCTRSASTNPCTPAE